MKNTQFGLVMILLLAVMGCGRLSDLVKKSSKDAVPDEVIKNAEAALKTDILADPPSPGAIVVRQLARLDPGAAAFEKTVENLERAGLKNFTAEIAEKNKLAMPAAVSRRIERTRPEPLPGFASVRPGPTSVLAMLQGQTSASPQIGVSPAEIDVLVLIVSVLNDFVAPALTEKGSVKASKREYNGTSYTDMSLEIGRGDAGATSFGFKMNTRGVNGNRSLDSDLEGKVEGVRCPDVLGNVNFTVTVKLSGKHADSSYIQDVKASVVAKTNDDADIASYSMKLNQGIQESVGRRNAYIETEFDIDGSGASRPTVSDIQVVRTSQDTGPHAEELATSGNVAATHAGILALKVAEAMWQNGACVALSADEPGNVEPSSVTEVPVNVNHKYDGSSVPSKVKVDLAGETSVSPKQIDQTPGKLSYTAPPEKNKSATIKLEARSKRGRAKLDLNATTGGNAYAISGNIDEASMSGTTCDSSQPFSIGGTLQFKFTPTSATTGTYTYKGPYSATGSGPYVINADGSMKLDGTGCIMGGNCKTYSHSWTATPIDPATCK